MKETRVNTPIGDWAFEKLADGLIRFRKHNQTPRKYRLDIVTSKAWLFGVVNLSRGTYRFVRDGGFVTAPEKQWGVFYPRFSLCAAELDHPYTQSEALWGLGSEPRGSPAEPSIFRVPATRRFPQSTAELADYLASCSGFLPISRSSAAHPDTVRLKREIDRHFESDCKISDLATALGKSHAQLSRQFKRDFDLTPVAYRNQLRVEASIPQLLDGVGVLDAALAVGYGDLSRYNRNMKAITGVQPSRFRGNPRD